MVGTRKSVIQAEARNRNVQKKKIQESSETHPKSGEGVSLRVAEGEAKGEGVWLADARRSLTQV